MSHGCFNRAPFKASLKVPDGWWDDGVQRIAKLITIPFRMAMDCQYTLSQLGQADQKCHGCKHRKDA